MNMFCYLVFFFCANYWHVAQALEFNHPERTLEWQHATLASKILSNLADSHPHENVVFSPLSVHTSMTLVYLGSEGETAQELYDALLPSTSNKEFIAQDYNQFSQNNFNWTSADFELRMASGIVVNQRYQLAETFYPLTIKLRTATKSENFTNGDNVVRLINNKVEKYTKSKIRNIMAKGSIDDRKVAVIVNAMYLKALWQTPFPNYNTRKLLFRLGGSKSVKVDMMSNHNKYRWAKIPKLNATVLELPYKNTDLTMLIVLPDETDGLRSLEKKIREENINWNVISDELNLDVVSIVLPKFKIEFQMDVKEQFEKLGVSRVFSSAADLSGMIENTNNGVISLERVQHKAFLQINEAGTEGAAASVAVMSNRSGGSVIRVDHPFMIVIRNRYAVFFIGHVVKPN